MARRIWCSPGPRDAEAVRSSHVRQRLARFVVPWDVVFVGDLPHNATGKIVEHELR